MDAKFDCNRQIGCDKFTVKLKFDFVFYTKDFKHNDEERKRCAYKMADFIHTIPKIRIENFGFPQFVIFLWLRVKKLQ